MAKNQNFGLTIAKALMRQLTSQSLAQQKQVKAASDAEKNGDTDSMSEFLKHAQLHNKEAGITIMAILDQLRGASAE